MKKRNNLDRHINLLNLAFLLLVSACQGQEQRDASKSPLSDLTMQATVLEPISQVVRMMIQVENGDIWFGTQGGAYKLRNRRLTKLEGIISESGTGVTIHDLDQAEDGKIWFAHTDGLSSWDGEKVTNYYKKDGLVDNDAWNVETDKLGNVWVGTFGGVSKFNGADFENFDLPEGERDISVGISSTKMVHCIMEDSKENIWFCTTAGLFRLNNEQLYNESEKLGIESNFVNEIIESKTGGYWISTKTALYKMTEGKLENITTGISDVGKGIGSMAEDNNGRLYFVLNQHYLKIYDGKEIKEFPITEDNRGPVIYKIFNDKDDRLWFLGFGGAFRLENDKFIEVGKNGPW